MIRTHLLILGVVSLSACGIGDTATQSAPPKGPAIPMVPTPPPPPPAPVIPTSDAASFTQAAGANSFGLSGTPTPIGLTRTDTTGADHTATYEVTIKGVTYVLTPDAANSANNPSNFFTTTGTGKQVSLFLDNKATHASILNTRETFGSGTKQYFSILGTLTDVASLPATAVYQGNGEISIDVAGGGFDDAPNSTVTLNADFAAGAITGQFDVSDPVGGGPNNANPTANLDINGSAVLPFTGTISGNSFTANVDYTNLVGITNGLNSVSAQPVTGGFYGPAGEEAVGTGLSLGSGTVANNTLIYTRIQATKQ